MYKERTLEEQQIVDEAATLIAAQYNLKFEDAYVMIRKTSMDTRLTVLEIATAIVEKGEL